MIRETSYDSAEVILVNLNSGKSLILEDNDPVFSPDGSRLVSYSHGMMLPDCIAVYEIKNGDFTELYRVFPKWSPFSPVWISNDHISLIRGETTNALSFIYFIADLFYENGAWKLVE